MTEDEILESFGEKVQRIIVLRKAQDEFTQTKNSPISAAHTYSGDVQMENEDKIRQLTKEADLDLVMLDDIAEARKEKYKYLYKILDILRG